jgi:hypothetical protein
MQWELRLFVNREHMKLNGALVNPVIYITE